MGGKCTRFMGGFKSNSRVVGGDANRGNYEPEISDIHFAVPDLSVYGSSHHLEMRRLLQIQESTIKCEMPCSKPQHVFPMIAKIKAGIYGNLERC